MSPARLALLSAAVFLSASFVLPTLAVADTCPSLHRALAFGARGTDVSSLQRFLAEDPARYPEGLVTGYFGPLTEAAVKRFQSTNGVVSSGTAATTGFGVAGPRTQAAIMHSCAAAAAPPSTTPSVIPIVTPPTPQITPPPAVNVPAATPPPAPAANPATSTPPQSTARGTLLLGACGSCTGGPAGVAQVKAFEDFMGRPVDYVLVWGWGQTAKDFEYSFTYLSNLWPPQYKLLWTVPMIINGTTFADATAGTYDAQYLSAARTIAARDPSATIRIGQEMTGDWEPWSIGGPAGSAADFAAAYRHIVEVFRSVSPTFTFDWNPGIGSWGGIDALPTYPGDNYVDFITADAYEDTKWQTGTSDARWQDYLTRDGRGLNWLSEFADAHHKPIGFDEWATNYEDDSFIRHMHDWMTTHNVAYQMYWNSDAAFDGSFATHPANGSLYRELFAKK